MLGFACFRQNVECLRIFTPRSNCSWLENCSNSKFDCNFDMCLKGWWQKSTINSVCLDLEGSVWQKCSNSKFDCKFTCVWKAGGPKIRQITCVWKVRCGKSVRIRNLPANLRVSGRLVVQKTTNYVCLEGSVWQKSSKAFSKLQEQLRGCPRAFHYSKSVVSPLEKCTFCKVAGHRWHQ